MELLWILFFLIALIYSSVGFGGGSSYIAIMLVMGIAIPEVRFTALFCNIIVVLGSTINYARAGFYNWKKVFSLIILSVPLAFLGGIVDPENGIYKTIAGIALLIASVLMLLKGKRKEEVNINLPTYIHAGIGGGIGLLSGFLGIGGGVFLAPVLHMIKWDNAKAISAAASFFILVNSAAGMFGQLLSKPVINYKNLIILGICVFIGGQIGNRLNIDFLKPNFVRIITAILIGVVGVRILYEQLF